MSVFAIHEELKKGGPWLGAARTWMQGNVKGGDTLTWSSNEMVSLPFCKLEELALHASAAAVQEERKNSNANRKEYAVDTRLPTVAFKRNNDLHDNTDGKQTPESMGTGSVESSAVVDLDSSKLSVGVTTDEPGALGGVQQKPSEVEQVVFKSAIWAAFAQCFITHDEALLAIENHKLGLLPGVLSVTPGTPLTVTNSTIQLNANAVLMQRMEFDDGRVGWYITHPDFYCDIEPDKDGIWSVFFRDKNGSEAFGERKPQTVVHQQTPEIIAAAAIQEERRKQLNPNRTADAQSSAYSSVGCSHNWTLMTDYPPHYSRCSKCGAKK
jgi:hypothetical protein